MKISHVEFYNFFDVYDHHPRENALYDVEFKSLFEVACTLRDFLFFDKTQIYRQVLAWLDNDRYILVFKDTYDVHYHGFFQIMEKRLETRSPFFNKIK